MIKDKLVEKKRNEIINQLNHTDLYRFSGCSKAAIGKTFLAEGFLKNKDGLMEKKYSTFFGSSIIYTVEVVENVEDVTETIKEKCQKRLGNLLDKKQRCLLLFLLKEHVLDVDLSSLKEFESAEIIEAMDNKSKATHISVLVDKSNGHSFFLPFDEASPVYAKSSKQLLKILS